MTDIRKFLFNGKNTLQLPARREEFATLREWLNSIADELELKDKTRKQLLIAADEIFSNIAGYGYPAGNGSADVAVEFDMVNRELALTFSDNGIPYNPLETPPPGLDKPAAEREIGGLGVFLVKKLMDQVSYRREKDRNILILKKRLVPEDGKK